MNQYIIISNRWAKTGFFLIFLLCVSGCMGKGSQTPQTFLLSGLSHPLPPEAANLETRNIQPLPAIIIGPVKMAQYLNRPQIITRSNGNEIFFGEFHLWAEPLKEGFSRVLVKNLSQLLSTDHIYVFPWAGISKAEYRVSVDILRFDGKLGGNAYLDVLWTLYEGDKHILIQTGRSSLKKACRDNNHEALVEAHNLLLLQFSIEIADVVKSHVAQFQGR